MPPMSVSSYQPVNWSNVSTIDDFIHAGNQSAGNVLGAGIVGLAFLVLLITMVGSFGWEAGLLSAGFVALILSMLFSYMGILSWTFVGMFAGLLVVMIAYIMYSGRNN